MTVRYLTADQVADIIGTGVEYVRRQCHSKQLRATKLGKSWRITEDALADFMNQGNVRATRPDRVRSVSSRARRRSRQRVTS